MRLSHSIAWLLMSFASESICSEVEVQLQRGQVDKNVGGETGGDIAQGSNLASISLTSIKTPIDSLVEVHEVIVTLEDIPDKPSPRHEQEKKNLMKRLSKSHGKWDTNHPRHRLMEALFGFSRYKVRQMAELNRWKDLYTHVSKAQKKVLEQTIGYSKKFETAETLHDLNQELCNEIVEAALKYYGISHEELAAHSKAKDAANQLADRVSVSQALKHFVRDWSTSGRGEREDAFPCILSTMESLFPDSSVLLVEGDFVSQFKSHKEEYDAIITHFFIDTARNVMSYFDVIHAALRPGVVPG
ncbi:Carnosine N-methyltransferase [Colletotrichum sp. SAR 10_65]|nr:Carnosine N-methyltransferase [Colletotrichum sp. SAR 10_65]